jgi:hypothetical protein
MFAPAHGWSFSRSGAAPCGEDEFMTEGQPSSAVDNLGRVDCCDGVVRVIDFDDESIKATLGEADDDSVGAAMDVPERLGIVVSKRAGDEEPWDVSSRNSD